MWVLSEYFITEYSYCKMPGNYPLNENEKSQISAHKLEEKSISFIGRELSRSRTVMRNYLKDPESYVTRKYPGRSPKTTNVARCRLFREVSKRQSSSRNLKKSQNLPITPTSPWIAKSRIMKQKDSPCFKRLTQEDARWLGKDKSKIDKRIMENSGAFWWENVLCGWARRLPVLLTWFKKGESAVFKKTIWRRICYKLGSFFCFWRGCFSSDGRKTKLCSIYQRVRKMSSYLWIVLTPMMPFLNRATQP